MSPLGSSNSGSVGIVTLSGMWHTLVFDFGGMFVADQVQAVVVA